MHPAKNQEHFEISNKVVQIELGKTGIIILALMHFVWFRVVSMGPENERKQLSIMLGHQKVYPPPPKYTNGAMNDILQARNSMGVLFLRTFQSNPCVDDGDPLQKIPVQSLPARLRFTLAVEASSYGLNKRSCAAGVSGLRVLISRVGIIGLAMLLLEPRLI